MKLPWRSLQAQECLGAVILDFLDLEGSAALSPAPTVSY